MKVNKLTGPSPKQGILDIEAYVGGNADMDEPEDLINIASNENPLGPSRLAMKAHKAVAETLNIYPDGSAQVLRQAIARRHGIPAEQIVCGAGSDELLTLLARAFAGPGDEILYSAHGFLMYPIVAKSVGATPVAAAETDLTASVDALLALTTERTRIVFLANPNNPTGSYLPQSEMVRLREGLPEKTLLVIDAAYAEYVSRNDYEPGVRMVETSDNVVMCRTFSKIYGLAALRIGWAYCPARIADILNRIRGPFNVSAPAIAAATAAMEDIAYTGQARELNDEGLTNFSKFVVELGLIPAPSVGNFVLVRFPGGDEMAAAAHRFLLSHSIRARAMGGYGLADCIRFTIGTHADMARVGAVLTQFMDGANGGANGG